MLKNIHAHWITLLHSVFAGLAGLFLIIESYEIITNTDVKFSFILFLLAATVIGSIHFFFDGYFISGFLKREIEISSNSFDSKVHIKFGDFFQQQGWKAVGVNDFFDSEVDDDLVAINSLHGKIINNYWPDDGAQWQKQINGGLKGIKATLVKRKKGNSKRYPIGTTAKAITGKDKFLFVAFGETNVTNNESTANAEMLICAVRGLLRKARSVCSNEPINIPLMGSGLARVGIRNAILVDLILSAIFEETKISKITDSITIVLPEEKSSEINLGAISRDWN